MYNEEFLQTINDIYFNLDKVFFDLDEKGIERVNQEGLIMLKKMQRISSSLASQQV